MENEITARYRMRSSLDEQNRLWLQAERRRMMEIYTIAGMIGLVVAIVAVLVAAMWWMP